MSIDPVYGIPVIETQYLQPGRVLLGSLGALTGWRDVGLMDGPPTITYDANDDGTPASEASRIVHQGLAEEIAWLRAAGRDVPTYAQQQQERRRWEKNQWTFRHEARWAMTIIRPGSDFVRVTGLP